LPIKLCLHNNFIRYFCSMGRILGFLFIYVLSGSLMAQVRVGKLVVEAKQTYTLDLSDILVADTLVMMDSSRIVLNKLKPDNFIRARVAVFGRHCIIDGKGLTGKAGRKGRSGLSYNGPCRDGLPGTNGTKGLDGTPGINLFLYLENVTMKGPLVIDVSGGNGGKGGDGGSGGGGSPGTLHCNGGNGANGGDGATGGNGARGGNLVLSSSKSDVLKSWVDTKIFVKNHGGDPGPGGHAGYHGGAGLGPSRKNGKNGEPGAEGKSGITGVAGNLTFESN
jgi:hypothetical protein